MNSEPLNLCPPDIVAYAEAQTSEEDSVLRALSEDTQAHAKLPQMQTGHVEGAFLRMLVQLTGARLVLDIGCYTGYSSLSMAMGLPDGGKVITCDVDPVATEMARKYWGQSPHGSKIDLRLGPALETLSTLDDPIDLVFIDADKENYIHYWEACLPRTRRGGLLVADNVLWSGRVLDPQSDSDRAIVAFNDHVRNDARTEAVLLTVRDGMTLARKK